eukprot:scaffold123793_cov28-Phaeocystis_antarctica.AAC.1
MGEERGSGTVAFRPLSCVGWSINVLQGPRPLTAAWSALCSCLSSSSRGRSIERSEGAQGAKSAKGARREPLPPPPEEQEELEQQLQVAAYAGSCCVWRPRWVGRGVVLVARPRGAPLTPPPHSTRLEQQLQAALTALPIASPYANLTALAPTLLLGLHLRLRL